MRGLVLKVEPRAELVRALPIEEPSGRRRLGAQTIAAVALLEFEMNDQGICSITTLQSLDSGTAGESALVTAVERKLQSLDQTDGRLVTFNGRDDLGMVRMASLRHRHFAIGAAATWLDDRRDAHDDISLMLAPERSLQCHGPLELATSLGVTRRRSSQKNRGPIRPERIAAELAVIRAMVIYLHLLSERHRNVRPLAVGVLCLSDMIATKARTSPHLQATLRAEIFESFAPIVF